MNHECKFCNKHFTTKIILKTHQSKAKYCLKLQDKKPEETYECNYCSKKFNVKYNYDMHIASHLTDPVFIKLQKAEDEITELKETIELKDQALKNALDQIKTLQESNSKEIKNQYLTKKYVKKQSRQEYDEKYVVYILTTQSLKKDRRYILGKAENLTNRLSTYNKTDEHEVVYYQKCSDEDNMKMVENLVFQKLKRYREQANRERFVLPEDKEIDLFIDVIKKCIQFIVK
jgi:hypothetical protein